MRRPAAGVVMIALLVACASAPSPTASPSSHPRLADGDLDLASIGWWRIGYRSGNEIPAHDQLVVGWLDGEVILRLPYEAIVFGAGGRPPAAWVRGPAAGRIVYAQTARNGEGEIRLVDMHSAEAGLLARLPVFPVDLRLNPDGRELYFALYEAKVGTGVWHASLEDPGAAPNQVLAPSLFDAGLAGADAIFAARAAFFAHLEVSVDGTRLALFECGTRCRVTVVELATGELVREEGDDLALWDDCLARKDVDVALCAGFAPLAQSVEQQAIHNVGVELPEAWSFDLECVAGEPAPCELQAVAVNGDQRVPLPALGLFSPNG